MTTRLPYTAGEDSTSCELILMCTAHRASQFCRNHRLDKRAITGQRGRVTGPVVGGGLRAGEPDFD